MTRLKKNYLILGIVLVSGILFYSWITSYMEKIAQSKPVGSYHSSPSIQISRKNQLFISSYNSTKKTYYSSNKNETYSFDQIWMEHNSNDTKIFPDVSNFKFILNIHMDSWSLNNLHEFKLLHQENFDGKLNGKIDHPYEHDIPRIRYLLNDVSDTLKLEVYERNPTDSLAWLTEKIIDTVVLIKKNEHNTIYSP